MSKNTCCFFGHRKIEITDNLKRNLHTLVQKLITEERVDTFLFGSKSQFDTLCYQIISELKENYPYIKRIYVRSHFPYISDDYKSHLLKFYEETYYPDKLLKSGKAAYVERNCEMINKSKYCVVCFNEDYTPPNRKTKHMDLINYLPKSGTKIAYDYARKKKRTVINLFNVV